MNTRSRRCVDSATLINVGYNEALIWDGRAWPLEKQAIRAQQALITGKG